DPVCDLCLKTACCQTYTTCVNEPDCNCVLNCATSGAAREDCEARCHIDARRVSEVVTLLEGSSEACDVQCGDRCRVFELADDVAVALAREACAFARGGSWGERGRTGPRC